MEKIQKFNKLPFQQRAILVCEFGKLIHKTYFEDYVINLYEIECEYVEVWYNTYRNEIWDIRMPTYQQMDVHVKDITIEQ